MTTGLRGSTVRRYLERLRDTTTISGATEHTYRAPLIDFLKAAAEDLGFGSIDVHSELRLAAVGQPDLQVTNADGVAVGYGETKVPGSATRFAEILASEQIERYRGTAAARMTARRSITASSAGLGSARARSPRWRR